MEDEIIEIYEYNDQTLELSLVTEEEIPEALEVVRDTFERTKNKKCKVFRLESDEKMRSYMTDKGFAVKAMPLWRDGGSVCCPDGRRGQNSCGNRT